MNIQQIVKTAELIPGWMTKAELTYLAEQASLHKQIVEIGCWKGRSTKALAMATKGIVFAVDNWYGEDDVPGDRDLLLFTEFSNNLAQETLENKVYYNYKNNDVDSFFADTHPHSFDMIFIDGGHDYESVFRDCTYAFEFIEPGGLVCGHDAFNPDVKRAVIDVFAFFSIVPGTAIWYWNSEEGEGV